MRLGRRLLLASAALAGLLVLGAASADACSCLPPNLPRSYNASTDVLRAQILLSVDLGANRFHIARVQRAYKGCYQRGQLVFLGTPQSSAACGVRFARGQTVLVTGIHARNMPRILFIHSCDANVRWESLAPEDVEFLESRFNCCGDRCACVNDDLVQCFADPCTVASCPDSDTCVSNYCGGCNAEFYDEFSQLVCHACDDDGDCGFGQRCSAGGRCRTETACRDDSDCARDAWCSPTVDGTNECRPFQQEGDWCGGFTPVWAQARCAPDLVCTDFPPFIADAPGICRRPCASNDDCEVDEYCSGAACRDDGTCRNAVDCAVPGNDYPHIACVGHPTCATDGLSGPGHCGWECGDPRCIDVARADFGACAAVLGVGVVDGQCVGVSGCSSEPVEIFSSLEECQQRCE
ncbi:MAG: hypothetical protein QNK03_01910 [Myxococcota bacterium]|nr:hypothetical protein [Myxococcota bacterium]